MIESNIEKHVSIKWIACPICQRKLALCEQGAKISGVFVKCPKCRQEIELNIPK